MAGENAEPSSTSPENQNKAAVNALYKALGSGDAERVVGLLATDLEWWFHGPQNCQHMMRVLTGESDLAEFRFEPRSITTIDDRVIVEGWEGAQAYWVHVWTLKDGIITQFREYFNTWLTVTELIGHQSPTLWQSGPRDLANRSLPGLVLAI
ncbi:Wound-induced protein [Actinidia chinensis var. chinensis]|uniref:Wound-induced protein n=1 Tax=Actinidia chinensis var. chinensis TaxID=1590841 RepID=A0A2R6RXH4_ACTCC|nr:Wound-induced protein [Actinidia chinensis var. chinensis]